MTSPITIETSVHVPVEQAWHCWTAPECVTLWNHASDDWHSPEGRNDLREGGSFSFRMEAKDGSVGFEFGGTYTKVEEFKQIDYTMDDGRTVSVTFDGHGDHTHVMETFDPELENTPEMQREGWQAILDNFAKHAEEHHG